MGCSGGYDCVTDPFGFNACRPSGLDISCDSDDDCTSSGMAGFTCFADNCVPVCAEGDDSGCEALTGAGSVCLTMDDGTGQKLSICDDSAVSTVQTTPAPTEPEESSMAAPM